MPRPTRLALRSFAVGAAGLALLIAAIWLWPASKVHWRTPVEEALAQKNCLKAVRILDAVADTGAIDAIRMRTKLWRAGTCYPSDASQIAARPLVVAAVAIAPFAMIWPWPTPDVDWRTPVDRAFARNDCRSVVEITETAASAGSIDAMRMLHELRKGGRCRNPNAGETVDGNVSFVLLFRKTKDAIDSIYGLASHDLGPLRRRYVSASLFLCAMPYNGLHRPDNVALSEIAPMEHGPIMALRRLRREICLEALEQMAGHLVAADNPAAKEVAYLVLTFPPLNKSPQANVLYARLLLEQAFVPKPITTSTTSDKTGLLRLYRNVAWLRLENAAKEGDLGAIRLLIAFLHEGRFHASDDEEAYFWLLRLRRLGAAANASDDDIEKALSSGDRDVERWREENDYTRTATPQ